jgi:hypothetical protein
MSALAMTNLSLNDRVPITGPAAADFSMLHLLSYCGSCIGSPTVFEALKQGHQFHQSNARGKLSQSIRSIGTKGFENERQDSS